MSIKIEQEQNAVTYSKRILRNKEPKQFLKKDLVKDEVANILSDCGFPNRFPVLCGDNLRLEYQTETNLNSKINSNI